MLSFLAKRIIILQGMEDNSDFVRQSLFLNSISDKCAPTGMTWFKPVFLITNF